MTSEVARLKQEPSNERADERLAAWRIVYLALLVLLLLSLILRAALTLNREFDMDEFQHLHTAWMVAHHYTIYKDFWEPHTPLLYLSLLPLFHFFRDGPGLVLAARTLMSFLGLGLLALTYKTARLTNDRLTSLIAVAVLSYMVIFVQKTIEIRPDQPLVAAWLASLWICARTLEVKARPAFVFLAGFILGIGFLFSPKGLIPLAAMMVSVPIILWIRKEPQWLASVMKCESSYLAGFLVPLAICFAVFYRAGILKPMFESTVLENFTFPHVYHPSYLLNLRNVCFLVLAFVGISWRLSKLKRASSEQQARHAALLLPNILIFAVIVLVVAYAFSQIVLLCAPVFAVYAADAISGPLAALVGSQDQTPDASTGRFRYRLKQSLLLAAAITLAFVIPSVMLLIKARPFTGTNSQQFATMSYVLGLTKPTDAVFDGQEAYVFRPQAYFYGALVQGIIWRIQQRKIPDDLQNALIESDCKVIIFDNRVAALPEADLAFLRARYRRSSQPGVWMRERDAVVP